MAFPPCVGLCDLLFRSRKTDTETFGFAEPAFALGFHHPVVEVVPDLFEPRPFSGVHDENRTPHTSVFVAAIRSVGPSAVSEGELPALEVAEELVPFFRSDSAVFPGWPDRAAAAAERAMRFDRVGGVERRLSHGGVEAVGASDDLSDVRRQAIEDGVGDEDPSEVMRWGGP
ncbi:hypothetical protein ABZ357_33190 [Streptomyces sp. NPDC005917]|uniref:hypothetical protein n=1 Tax=unclassified Streptomyces TaxID=2593676 RepID=UPI0033C73DE6